MISYRGYKIRTVQPDDIECIRRWRNAQMVVLRQKREISTAEQLMYFEQQIWPSLDDPYPQNLLLAYFFNNQLIGYGGLVHIAWEHLRAEVSFLLDPARVNDPLCNYVDDFLAFLELIKTLAFDDLNLQRLFTETYSTRVNHIRVLEAADFILEGVLRRHVILDGRPVDSLIHGCLINSYAR